jgi:quercetin dioxygenase-like cupin family protein
MSDTSFTKVDSRTSSRGGMGQKYRASGKIISMGLWKNEAPGHGKPETKRNYETAGYAIEGQAELHLEGQVVMLNPGDSWIVPKGTMHRYEVLEP